MKIGPLPDACRAHWIRAFTTSERSGWIELKHTCTTPNDLVTLLIFTAILGRSAGMSAS